MGENVNPVIRARIKTAQRLDISEIPPQLDSDLSNQPPTTACQTSHQPGIGQSANRRSTNTHPSDSSWLELFAIDHDKGLLCWQARCWPRDTETSEGPPVLGWNDFHDDLIPRLKRILGPAYFGLR